MNTPLILPLLGDAKHVEGEIVSIIGEGARIKVGDTLMEVETDKVVVEVPSPSTGTIASIDLKVGDKVKGGVAFGNLIADSEGPTEENMEESTSPQEAIGWQTNHKKETIPDDKVDDAVLTPSIPHPVDTGTAIAPLQTGTSMPAGPAARSLARKLGVDISAIRGTARRGRISKDDVLLHAKLLIHQSKTEQRHSIERKLPDPGELGPVHKEPLTGIARATSRNMQFAWSEVPHAWIQEDVDLTEIESLRKKFKKTPVGMDIPLTVTAILCKVSAVALERFPKFNCALDAEKQKLIYREYINVGVAVDTERGLVVPVLRSVNEKSAIVIARELKAISEKAKSSTLSMKDFQGGGFTVSNLGGIGVSGMFPIVKWPEVAILGVGSTRLRPVFVEGDLSERAIMSLTLGFDHRVINGADAARFLQFVRNCLEDPGMLLFDS